MQQVRAKEKTREGEGACERAESCERERPCANEEINAEIAVSFVLPCLNEVKTLPECIGTARAAVGRLSQMGLDSEIVVADNGSTDGSVEMAADLGCRVIQVRQRGYGAALIHGMKAARGRFLVMGDSDASYDFRDAVPMVERLKEGFDLCMGNRFAGGIDSGAMPWKNRYVGNPALTGLLNLFFRSGIGDAHCGLRALTKSAFEGMRLGSSGMEFASEMVVKASLLGMKTTEVPVGLHPDKRDGPPHLRPWRDGWRHLKFLLMLSPFWLFVVPSALLMAFSTALFSVLLMTPPHQVFRIGPIWFGDHWMILAGGMFQLGFSGLVLGAAAALVSVREGYRKTTRLLRLVGWAATVEHALAAGGVLCTAGIGVLAYVFNEWGQAHFGRLEEIRPVVVATTLLLIGMQTVFGGFLLTMLNGHESEPESDGAFEAGAGDPTDGKC